jgi:hypothetical protein
VAVGVEGVAEVDGDAVVSGVELEGGLVLGDGGVGVAIIEEGAGEVDAEGEIFGIEFDGGSKLV